MESQNSRKRKIDSQPDETHSKKKIDCKPGSPTKKDGFELPSPKSPTKKGVVLSNPTTPPSPKSSFFDPDKIEYKLDSTNIGHDGEIKEICSKRAVIKIINKNGAHVPKAISTVLIINFACYFGSSFVTVPYHIRLWEKAAAIAAGKGTHRTLLKTRLVVGPAEPVFICLETAATHPLVLPLMSLTKALQPLAYQAAYQIAWREGDQAVINIKILGDGNMKVEIRSVGIFLRKKGGQVDPCSFATVTTE